MAESNKPLVLASVTVSGSFTIGKTVAWWLDVLNILYDCAPGTAFHATFIVSRVVVVLYEPEQFPKSHS